MEKRVCDTCGLARSKSSFACHYESHSEICHACKDFCLHRVKLAHSKGLTVHELFARESDQSRLRRYQALTDAGVVWQHVARRHHGARTRRRPTKRRRDTPTMAAPTPTPSSMMPAAPPATQAPPKRRRRTYALQRRSSAAAVSYHGSKAASTPSVPPMHPRRSMQLLTRRDTHLLVDDSSSVSSAASDSALSAASGPVPCMPVIAPILPSPGTAWPPSRGRFEDAIAAIMDAQTLAASPTIVDDEFAATVAELDAAAPPLFDSDFPLDERLLALDANPANSEWLSLAALAPPSQDASTTSSFYTAPLTVCM